MTAGIDKREPRRRVWIVCGSALFLQLFAGLGSYGRGQSSTGAPPSPATSTQGPQRPAAPAQPPAATGAPVPAGAVNPNPGPNVTPVAPTPKVAEDQAAKAASEAQAASSAAATLRDWTGLRVERIAYEGVVFSQKNPLPSELAEQAGQPLEPAKVAASIRRLFASGLYRDIQVRGERTAGGVVLTFVGTPQYFTGRIQIEGVNQERLASLLEYSTKLQPGAPFMDTDVATGTEGVRQALISSGYFQPVVTPRTELDEPDRQVNVFYKIDMGPQARIGEVAVEGTDVGFTPEEFRKKAKLKKGRKVNRDTVSNALSRLRTQYHKRDRLEAAAALKNQTYDQPKKQVDYDFNADQGPVVKVVVQGTKIAKSRLKLLVPIYQEGAVDNDLLNEGSFNIKDFLFREGYFEAAVTVRVDGENTPSETVVYTVDPGKKHKVQAVTITGNKYFDDELLAERMQVQKADLYVRSGRYSPQLMKSDENAILALYRANGFNKASITTTVKDFDKSSSGKPLKVSEITVNVAITEGPQQKFGPVMLNGVDASRGNDVKALLSSQQGQPYSLANVTADRDAILNFYLSHGFSQAKVDVQQRMLQDASRTDVTLAITEGQQVFIDKVLESGRTHTKQKVIDRQIEVHPGDPLDQSALLTSQRKLYGLALFNEVNTAVQNPDGDNPLKNVLVQLTEARRWDVTYGFGFEAQTGTPPRGNINPASAILLGLPPNAQYSQNGHTGISPRVSLDVTRINFRGTDQSLTLHTTYGLLQRLATLTLNDPHFLGSENWSSSISGGYSNVQNITTFQASTLQGDYRVTQKYKKADTFIYDFQYRRVAVNPATLQVSANLIPLLSQPVRVGGPGVTWFHDTRQPGPLEADRGMYTSIQEFLASSKFGSQTSFNRVDLSNSTYYHWGKHPYVLARNTRVGFETSFGTNTNVNSSSCVGDLLQRNASCNPVPLPERLYAGGANSHRGFGINNAGPRDLQTGFPVGGSGVFVNTIELRLPPPVLPIVGNSVNFVLFHDWGNVYRNISDIFPSLFRFRQPNQQTCRAVGPTDVPPITTASPFGVCDFNYASHAVGLGARYKTPVGPLRVDFSYNLNPPVYPVIYDFSGAAPHSAQAGHFNFFFSIGESF
jgi:outer membrane protein insertion porin family